MHYYKFNIADYRKDTTHLSALEHGIYRQLLDWYYLDELPLPAETQMVMRRLRLGSESDIQALKNVLADFFELRDDGYHQPRCDAAIKEYHHGADKNKNNGKLGGRPKKTQSVILGNPDVSRDEATQKATTNPPTINHELTQKKTAPRERVASLKPDDVDQQTWDDWTALRIKKRATVSQTVLNEARAECAKADLTLERFLQIWCMRGSQGLQADWLKPNEISPYPAPRLAQQETFKERDARIGRERWEQMTGQVHPDSPPRPDRNVIDVPAFAVGKPTFLEVTQ